MQLCVFEHISCTKRIQNIVTVEIFQHIKWFRFQKVQEVSLKCLWSVPYPNYESKCLITTLEEVSNTLLEMFDECRYSNQCPKTLLICRSFRAAYLLMSVLFRNSSLLSFLNDMLIFPSPCISMYRAQHFEVHSRVICSIEVRSPSF